MAIRQYVITYEDFLSEHGIGVDNTIGDVKDNYLSEPAPTSNYGESAHIYMGVGYYAGSLVKAYHPVFEIMMPSKEDIPEMEYIEKVELILTNYSENWINATYVVIGIVEIPDDFDEGDNSAPGWSNWNAAQDSVPWINGLSGLGGCSSRMDAIAEVDGVIFDSIRFQSTGAPATISFDLTEALKAGERKRFALFAITSDLGTTEGDRAVVMYYSREAAVSPGRPVLRVTYRDYQIEAFEDKESALSIEPNPNNPEQPLLKWGGVKDSDFVDFKLYRETSPITTVALLTPIATITSPADQEYIDAAVLTDNQTYYYLVIAEDGNNTLDDATFSNQIVWTKPDVTTATISVTGTQNVFTSETITVVSPQNIKRLFVDWGDDPGIPANDVEAWYEYETTGTTKTATHVYTKYTGGSDVGIYVQVEDEDGFWSSLTALTGSSAKFNDTTPVAKLVVSAKKAIEGDTVTLNATFSQPSGSNVTITKYEFKRYAADSWQDNGTNPIYSFATTAFGVGTITASLQITTSSSLQDTDTATYVLESGTPTDITPGVTGGLSSKTRIHDIEHVLAVNKQVDVPIGGSKTAKEILISTPPERLIINATTEYPKMKTDLDIIRSARDNNSYLRLSIYSETETKVIQYDFMIDGNVSIGHRFKNKLNWSFPIRVIARTEVAKTLVYGVITAFANPGGGQVTITSAAHGLKNGSMVLIRDTKNYNGTYVVQNSATDTFRITATWVSNDAMGKWQRIGLQ